VIYSELVKFFEYLLYCSYTKVDIQADSVKFNTTEQFNIENVLIVQDKEGNFHGSGQFEIHSQVKFYFNNENKVDEILNRAIFRVVSDWWKNNNQSDLVYFKLDNLQFVSYKTGFLGVVNITLSIIK